MIDHQFFSFFLFMRDHPLILSGVRGEEVSGEIFKGIEIDLIFYIHHRNKSDTAVF